MIPQIGVAAAVRRDRKPGAQVNHHLRFVYNHRLSNVLQMWLGFKS